MKRNAHSTQIDGKASAAFTLTELLVVVGVLTFLALTMIPALARSQPHSRTTLCQHNLKQLGAAWQMYAEDYSGRIVSNKGQAGWATGWLDWTTASDNTNVLYLIDKRYAALAPYLNGASNLFKCPADNYLSSSQRSRGWTGRVRSYSVNAYVGENVPLGQPGGPSGPPIYRQTRKVSDFLHPAPAEVAVFIEEHPDSMNDPAFLSPDQTTWIDSPGTHHNGAATFAFADGHTEVHQWRSSLATGPATRVSYVYINNYPTPAGDEDISWLSYRTPRISALSY